MGDTETDFDSLVSDDLEIAENNPKEGKRYFSKIILAVAVFFLFIIIAVSILYAFYLNEINKPLVVTRSQMSASADDSTKIFLTIEKGMSTQEIGEYLKKNGILRNPDILKIYMFLNKDKTIQAGFYRVDISGKSLADLVEIFQNGSFDRRLTFIEGWRLEQYIDYLKKTMGEEFSEDFAKSDFTKEGYMFPDTYIITVDYEPSNLASWMRNNFKKKVSSELVDKAEFRNLSLEEVVILASIVEREMNVKSDRPKVAGILIKRWKNKWPLQVDSTIQYIKGNEENWWPEVTKSDLRSLKSAYNTYLNRGLPPGPISNPSLDSIKAVINYEETPYWFYVTGKDGITRYAETLEEHNANIEKYL